MAPPRLLVALPAAANSPEGERRNVSGRGQTSVFSPDAIARQADNTSPHSSIVSNFPFEIGTVTCLRRRRRGFLTATLFAFIPTEHPRTTVAGEATNPVIHVCQQDKPRNRKQR